VTAASGGGDGGRRPRRGRWRWPRRPARRSWTLVPPARGTGVQDLEGSHNRRYRPNPVPARFRR